MVIYIILFRVFIAIVLSALVTDFPIWKSFVIFSTISNKRPIDNKRIIKPADVEELVIICYK